MELVDQVAGLAVAVDAAGVVVGAQVTEAGGGIGQQVPDDHQDRAGDGDQGFALADAPDQAAVALAEEVSVLAAAVAASPSALLREGLPLPVVPARRVVPDWMGRGARLAPDPRRPGGGDSPPSRPAP